jgi:peptidyl-prolyl cis-trans isomerase D
MLNFMRQNANSWIMIMLFSIIIFVFAINFGPWAGSQASSVPYAVIINNQPISMAEFRAAYASQFARIKQFRPDYDQSQADRDGLKQLVLEQLVSRELLFQLGTKHQLSVGAKTLAEEIKERVFGKEADFNKEEYVRRVNAFFQSTVSQFEQQVAKELVAEQMANLLGTAVSISDAEAMTAFKDRSTKVAIEFVKINPQTFAVSRTFSADEIKRFQDEHGKKINDYYNEHIGEYVKEAEIRASHILIKVPPEANAQDKALLKEKAQKVLDRLKTEDFATVAQSESDDVGTKTKGGDLGFFPHGNMVEEFSKAAFALKPGEMSGIVESPFGFHIIKQTEQKAKVERKLEDTSAEIAESLLKKTEQEQKAKELAEVALSQLRSGVSLHNLKVPGLTLGKTESAQAIADETEPFNLSASFIYKLGRADGISDEIAKLTMDKPTADKVVVANGELIAIRLKSREDADPTKFEEQKPSIISGLMFPRKRAFTQQYVAHLKSSAKIKYNEALLSAPQVDG